ncbi:MAG: HPr(Ser) kinase/phosphatase [Clostridia bacterium]|nr:HPr(Ser) kinase/phosphatase [Clostridiales bacterium]MBQ3505921.1 HPr(Ser) kinase/phosphatase [Clostridia bacterium]
MSSQVTQSVMLDKFAYDLHLETVYTGRGVVTLASMSVERPGLQLAGGFFDYFDPRRILVLGLAEYEYLRTFSAEERKDKVDSLFMHGEIPCIILSRDLPALPELVEMAKKYACPVFRSPKMTTDLMSDLYIYLNRLLAPSVTEHGVLMEVFGVGILLTGKSGVGKSETAMELIKRGHRLIADDNVIIKEIANELYGTAPEIIRYFMELRGIGIINVKSMYGSGSVLDEKTIQLVIQLENWQQGKEYDRIGDEMSSTEYLGIKIPKLTIPVSPGRNLAIIIEVAARNFRLKSMGYDASEELITRSIGR